MSRIEEMIAEMCPDGVEYYALKDVVNINRGKRVTKKELSDDAPYIAYHGSKDTPLGRYHKSNAPEDTTIVVNTGSVGGVKYCSEAFWCSDGSYWLSSDKFASKFLYYYLQQYEKFFMENKREGGVPTLDKTLLENVQLPLVPIEIQNEIIQVLETFEELEAELEAELEGRRRQYEYYRNLLLSFDKRERERRFIEIFCQMHGIDFDCDRDLEWKPLHQLMTRNQGMNITANNMKKKANPLGDVKVFAAGKTEVMMLKDDLNAKRIYNEPSVICKARGNIDFVFYDKPFTHKSELWSYTSQSENINPKFYYYHLSSLSRKLQAIANERSGKLPQLRTSDTDDLQVPVLPLPVQQLIVDTLDKFSTLTEDIIEGLPKELELHRKQYEYYRNCLLSFPRREDAGDSEAA